uniref:AAA+ ATPase domain-containing protein n=1 Tax=Mycena chlorophos TaxID=658473 RepID=A0ABQ0KZR0_MYCCL|nr:predicted protein [Mycena chlorophos]
MPLNGVLMLSIDTTANASLRTIAEIHNAVQEKLSLLNANHPQIDSIDEAAEFLSTILTGLCFKAGRLAEEPLASFAACRARLSVSPRLYRALQTARLSGELALEEYEFTPPLVSGPCQVYLNELQPNMQKIANAKVVFQPWDPRTRTSYTDETLLNSLRSLGLSAEYSRLSIILFELGTFSEDETLRERVDQIFTSRNKFLVNSSGTGKTRLCYEGLCRKWGFYLTCKVDSGRLGSSDVQSLLDLFGSERREHVRSGRLDKNVELIADYFGAILLARLIVLLLFLDTLKADISERHKRHWLEMQLKPSYISQGVQEPFETVARLLIKHDSARIGQGIRTALTKVRHILGGGEPLFLVLDEASLCVERFSDAFDGECLLQAILRVFMDTTGDNFTIICSGIGLPQSRFQSGVGSDFEWTSFTGAFDDPERQEQYIRKFLPPTLRDSESGRFLIARMWRWLRGRHRATAALLQALLLEGMEHPHSRLDAFIKGATSYEPVDAIEYVAAEGRTEDWKIVFDVYSFRPLSEEEKDIVLERLFRYMATHQPSPLLGPEHMQLVYDDPARIVDANLSQIAFDEPSALLGYARELFPYPERPRRGQPHERPATFLRALRRNAPQTEEGLAHCLVFYLTQALGKGRRLDEIFSFPHRAPAWAKQTVELVRFHRESGDLSWSTVAPDDFESFRPLATQATSVDGVITWMEHEIGTAFCLPPPTANASILVVVRLADESFVWVALKALATDQPLHVSDLKVSFAALQVDALFGELDDAAQERVNKALDSLPQTGRCKLLRAVSSFPVEIAALNQAVNSRTKDAVVVSIAALESKSYQVMQTDLFDAVVAGVLAGHKRKSPWESEDGKLYTSSKRSQTDDHWDAPQAWWDGPVDDDDLEEGPSSMPSPRRGKSTRQVKRNPPAPVELPARTSRGTGRRRSGPADTSAGAASKKRRLGDSQVPEIAGDPPARNTRSRTAPKRTRKR